MATRDPMLAYVLHEGGYCHVSRFARLSPRARPQVFCPECEREVILHLGQQYAHHAAHRPGAVCALTRPETARHFNTKLHLYTQLSKRRRLLIAQPCYGWWAPTVENVPGGHVECTGKHRPYLWLEGWDRVEVEKFVGSRKPDIVIYRGNQAVAAIEVRATHAVDMDKRADLEALGLPWIEIAADEDFYGGEEPWTPDKPVDYLECSQDPPYWTCDWCRRREAGYEKHTRERLTRDREQRREEARLRAEEARTRREHQEAHERWRREEVRPLPWMRRPNSPPAVVRTKTVRDGQGREIVYTVRQETVNSHVILRAGEELVAASPGPYSPDVARFLTAAYKNHRKCLGPGVTDVTQWENGEENETSRGE